MNYLGASKKIVGMKITRGRRIRKLMLSQQSYVEKVLKRFNMIGAKSVSISLTLYFKFCRYVTKDREKNEIMFGVLYSNVVGSIIYVMVCTCPDIAHDVRVLNSYMTCPSKRH